MIQPQKKRRTPTWAEIFLSLGCSMMIATSVLTGRSSALPQTAEAYYTAYKEVQSFHFWMVAVDVLVLVTTLGWILLTPQHRLFKGGLLVLSVAGIALSWGELGWANQLHTHRVFNLNELPFRPLGNGGLVGAELFGTYLLLQLPSGKVGGWQSVAIKAGLAVCFWALQLLVWDGIHRSSGAGA